MSDNQDTVREEPDAAIRILLVDDHTVMRAGTRRILEDEPDFVVVGEASDGNEALLLAHDAQPTLVVLDIGMPNMDGIQTCRTMRERWPELHILILTGHDNDALVRMLHRIGVEGYLLKSAGPHELIGAIREVARGQQAYGEEPASALAHQGTYADPQPTPKELEVLLAVASGKRNREIAKELHLSVNTVEFHLRNIFTKLGAASRADAIGRARRHGWLDTQDLLC
ncbi:MAG TPA: response regulator transcription factor [Ktedonobacterales bacterium]|nr:response regulator transcription factor [Ktedonobacterales bacterium]